MSDNHGDYLWDRSGKLDPEIERLEAMLGRLGQEKPAPPLNFAINVPPHPRPYAAMVMLAAAAVIVLSLVSVTWWTARAWRGAAPGLTVTSVEGVPKAGAPQVTTRQELRVGGWLDTAGGTHATIEVGDIGRVDVEPGSRLGLLSTKPGDYRLHLARGTLHALIWAPPGQFFVETPSSTVVDLGCAYTLTVGDDEDGLVRVTSGWVGFEWRGRESFIPAGAVCRTRRGLGPGTPHYEDAGERFRAALDTLDVGDAPFTLRAAALDAVIEDARERDAVSLWHLLTRVPSDQRDRVFNRLAEFVPPPQDVTRDGIRAGRRDMLDAWWNRLGLDTASWWRTWKQQWRGDKGDD